MTVLISGLDEQACMAYLGVVRGQDGNHPELRWEDPERFLKRRDESASAAFDQPATLLWLYRAPWTIQRQDEPDPAEGAAALEQWYRRQRAALSMRRMLGGKMRLVNVDRVAATAIASELALASAPLAEPDQALDPELDDALTQGLAKLFDWALPQYWDLFEDLEAAAWLPRGEPLFRQNLLPGTTEDIEHFTRILTQGLRYPKTRAQLSDSLRALRHAQTQRRENSEQLDQERAALAEVRERLEQTLQELERAKSEQTKLSAERHRVQALFDEEQSRLAALEQELSEAQHGLTLAKQAAAEAQALLETQSASANAKERALRLENERLESELREARTELDGQASANQSLRTRLARSTETLDRARVQLCRQLARSGGGQLSSSR